MPRLHFVLLPPSPPDERKETTRRYHSDGSAQDAGQRDDQRDPRKPIERLHFDFALPRTPTHVLRDLKVGAIDVVLGLLG